MVIRDTSDVCRREEGGGRMVSGLLPCVGNEKCICKLERREEGGRRRKEEEGGRRGVEEGGGRRASRGGRRELILVMLGFTP
jgi:hypothetical protein